MKVAYYKALAITFFAFFLLTVLRVQSIALLALTSFFAYKFIEITLKSLTQKDLLHLVPKKFKKHIEQQSVYEYVSSLEVVKSTPILKYFLPLLKNKSQTKSSIQLSTNLKTTSAIVQSTNQIEGEVDFLRKPLQLVCQSYKEAMNLQNSPTSSLQIQIQSMKKEIQPLTLKQNRALSLNKTFNSCNEQKANLTTCESNSNNNLPLKANSNIGGRKPSIIMKKKFAQQSSSVDEAFDKKYFQQQKRIHRSNSQNKLVSKNKEALVKVDNAESLNSRSVLPHNQHPLKIVEQYLQALLWMMKRLLGLRKLTSKIRKASTLKISIIVAVCWISIILQIKIDSKKGKLLFKSLRAFLGILSILATFGASSMLIYKTYESVTGDHQKERPRPQGILFERK